MNFTRKIRPAMAACLLGVSFISSANRQTQLALDIDVANRGPEIGNLHYGIFFEEINHAGDGGPVSYTHLTLPTKRT